MAGTKTTTTIASAEYNKQLQKSDWLTINNDTTYIGNSEANTSVSVKFAYTENLGNSSRSKKITLTAGDITKEVILTQNAGAEIDTKISTSYTNDDTGIYTTYSIWFKSNVDESLKQPAAISYLNDSDFLGNTEFVKTAYVKLYSGNVNTDGTYNRCYFANETTITDYGYDIINNDISNLKLTTDMCSENCCYIELIVTVDNLASGDVDIDNDGTSDIVNILTSTTTTTTTL